MDKEELRRLLTEASERAQECGEAIRDALVSGNYCGEVNRAGAHNGEVRDALNAAIRILDEWRPVHRSLDPSTCSHPYIGSVVDDGVRYCGRCGWAWAVVRPGDLRA